MTRSMLHRLEDLCNVDVDDADTELIKSIPFTPHNPDEALLKDLVRQYGSQGWERVYDQAAVHLTARNIPHLSGRVLIQTSLRHVSSSAATLAHARRLAALYEEAGVPRDRFAIKIPFSGPAAAAAAVLNAEGIRTLATGVFSLEQGIAASQSGCLFISPYYNEIAAHLDPSLRLTLEDPALEHPMSPRVIHILEAFAKAYRETGKEQPIMPTKLNYGEFATVQRLTKLSTIDPFARPDWDGKLADMQTDYIANDGEKLDEALNRDPVAGKRLKDAELFFIEMENKAKEAIEKEIAAQGL
ncbi:aldolase [Trichoderma longibrachiatum ATCC 18648]|uniref:Aldolase n=1 Tax=Trichoderma longibrachiatum ATCC 18648 TaxID=983965 RepID=A0A2T4C0D9_TRILO|nr:aldolase [Trichoderma longibrachiatum ATCC 18648]